MAIFEQVSRKNRFRQLFSKVMLILMVVATCLALIPLLLVMESIVVQGLPYLKLDTFRLNPTPMGTPGGGLKNGILGTIELLIIASCIGLPLGILGGVYLVEFGGRFSAAVRFLTDVLNSVPSIIIGVFVYVMVVLPTAKAHPGSGYSAFAGGIALGIMMIPTIIRTTEEMLRLVPQSLRDGALALGAARWRAMATVILPAARGGVITGIMLALARIAGETAPLLFTAFGNNEVNFALRSWDARLTRCHWTSTTTRTRATTICTTWRKRGH